jgi:hypothetical protein
MQSPADMKAGIAGAMPLPRAKPPQDGADIGAGRKSKGPTAAAIDRESLAMIGASVNLLRRREILFVIREPVSRIGQLQLRSGYLGAEHWRLRRLRHANRREQQPEQAPEQQSLRHASGHQTTDPRRSQLPGRPLQVEQVILVIARSRGESSSPLASGEFGWIQRATSIR